MIIEPNLVFDHDSHKYTYTKGGTKVLTSVTTAIKQFSKPFDTNEWASKVAARDGLTTDQVQAKWKEKQKAASDLGTYVHSVAEAVAVGTLKGRYVQIPMVSTNGCKQIIGLYKWFMEHLEIFYGDLQPELRICWPAAGLAGTIDLLAYNYNGSQVALVDYKTNESLNLHGYSNMLPPFQRGKLKLSDCNLSHYSLQLNLYRLMLRQQYALEVDTMVLVHLDRYGNFEEITIPFMYEHAWAIVHELNPLWKERHNETHDTNDARRLCPLSDGVPLIEMLPEESFPAEG